MVAMKSHNLLSASWRTQKANDIIQFSLKAQELGAPRSEDRRRWTSQVPRRERLCDSLHPFVLLKYSMDNVLSHWWGKISLISPLIQTLISFRNTFPDALRNYVLPGMWSSLSSVKWTHKGNHHTHIINQYSQAFSCMATFGPPNNSGPPHYNGVITIMHNLKKRNNKSERLSDLSKSTWQLIVRIWN